jgi:hypothetical protein
VGETSLLTRTALVVSGSAGDSLIAHEGAFGEYLVEREPGSPWENGYIESFNSKFRDELVNGQIFYTLKEAKTLIEK